jgi:hypothetical protein
LNTSAVAIFQRPISRFISPERVNAHFARRSGYGALALGLNSASRIVLSATFAVVNLILVMIHFG